MIPLDGEGSMHSQPGDWKPLLLWLILLGFLMGSVGLVCDGVKKRDEGRGR